MRWLPRRSRRCLPVASARGCETRLRRFCLRVCKTVGNGGRSTWRWCGQSGDKQRIGDALRGLVRHGDGFPMCAEWSGKISLHAGVMPWMLKDDVFVSLVSRVRRCSKGRNAAAHPDSMLLHDLRAALHWVLTKSASAVAGRAVCDGHGSKVGNGCCAGGGRR